jgi:alpha-L-rhamnosidase
MKHKHILFITLAIFISINCFCKQNSNEGVHITNLKVESAINPTGIDILHPRFSWQIYSQGRGASQTAYRIMVASSIENVQNNHSDLWDSGIVTSDETLFIPYAGKQLSSKQYYYWKVKIWDEDGVESEWSPISYWSMGLLNADDWKGQWIGLEKATGTDDLSSRLSRLSARMLRKEFSIKKEVKHAVASICGLGLFELYINGDKIGDQVLAPALSEYRERSYYLTFDVTMQLRKGENALGVILGNGRYLPPRLNPRSKLSNNSGFPKMIFQLDIEYTDGTTEIIFSDETWKLTTDGPIIANNELDGEEYDATREMPGWNSPGFDDSKWRQAEIVNPASPQLKAQPIAPIKVMETIEPISMNEVEPNVFIFDMGQNMVGWVKIKIKGVRGSKITLRFAETLQPDGNLYTDNLRSAKATNIYTLKGNGIEVYEPRFTYHGFRFVEVTGCTEKPELIEIEGKVVHDNLFQTGSFETSDPLINTLYQNAVWGIRGNYRSIPTDCPQRDERQGWLGDRAYGSKGETFIFDNSRFYAKWMQDIADAQRYDGSIPDVAPTFYQVYTDNVTWPGTFLIISYTLYKQYGDMSPIRKHYDSFRKWILYFKDRYMVNGIVTKDKYGDWCVPPESPELIHTKDSTRITSAEVISTTYYYHMLALMQEFAKLLNKEEDVEEYKRIAEIVYQAYNQEFYDENQKYYGNNTVTANLLSLAFDLVPEENRQAVFNNIVSKTMHDHQGHISTGLVGSQWIHRIFTLYGRPDVAWKIVTNTEYPSLGYMVKNGATTIWELWNGNTADPSMNSHNHLMLLGDVLIWFYEDLAGIKSDPEAPGFQHIIMKPTPVDDLKFVKASYKSTRGLIRSEWNIKDSIFEWNITIPANSTATIHIPAKSEDDVMEGSEKALLSEDIQFIQFENERAVFKLVSGTYQFVSAY